MYVAAESGTTWPEAILTLGIILAALLLIGGAAATYLEFRKDKRQAQKEEDLRQLVNRYEQLAGNTFDAQQRIAADVSELRSRTASVEQILRTVD
jgi:flagellar basal body-associated protein FliL